MEAKHLDTKSNKFKLLIPPLIFILVALFVLMPQYTHHALLLGSDSNFHFNQFYEAMQQIKTGHFSYFQSLFSFGQTGRIVNAIYGPFLVYLGGFLLLFCKNWLHFQFITAIIQFTFSGYFMYLLSRHVHVKKVYSYIIALLYMNSYAPSMWIVQQQATGWGAVFIPLVIWQSFNLIHNHKFNAIYFALAMAVLMQVHLISAIIVFVALIPIVITGIFNNKNKQKILKQLGITVALTLALTANLWGSILSLFHQNNIIPVFPQKQLAINALGLQQLFKYSYSLGLALTIVFIFTILLTLLYWKNINVDLKVIFITGLVFLYASSRLFPWQTLRQYCPTITNLVQFPRRLLVIATLLLLIVFGKILSNMSFNVKNAYILNTITITVLSFLVVIPLIHNQLWIRNEAITYNTHIFNEPTAFLTKTTNSKQQLKKALDSQNKAKAIYTIQKSTPDYLPSNKPLNNDNQYYNLHPYHYCNLSYLSPTLRKGFHKKIVGRNTLSTSWKVNKPDTITSVPVTVYYDTQVKLNHHIVKHPQINSVGALQIMNHHKHENVSITYQPSFIVKVCLALMILSWIATFAYLSILEFKKYNN